MGSTRNRSCPNWWYGHDSRNSPIRVVRTPTIRTPLPSPTVGAATGAPPTPLTKGLLVPAR